jgi:hypothetical protein
MFSSLSEKCFPSHIGQFQKHVSVRIKCFRGPLAARDLKVAYPCSILPCTSCDDILNKKEGIGFCGLHLSARLKALARRLRLCVAFKEGEVLNNLCR